MKEKMDGVSGFNPWKNMFIININKSKNWKKAFRDAVCHELAHAIMLNYSDRKTLRDNLIYEGVAEHFKEAFVNKEKSKWVKSISKKKAIEILKNIKNKLDKHDDKLYKELFFGSNKYSKWSGYSIGYYIVEDFLEKTQEKDWNKIFKNIL